MLEIQIMQPLLFKSTDICPTGKLRCLVTKNMVINEMYKTKQRLDKLLLLQTGRTEGKEANKRLDQGLVTS